MPMPEETKEKPVKCRSPYCGEETEVAAMPFCQPCGITLHYCVKCQTAVPREAEVCPQCGGELEVR